jgi:hypothetical protein
LGRWNSDGSGLYAVDQRGYAEYIANLPSDDAYRIEIEGRERDYKKPYVELPLIISVDGETVGRFILPYTSGSNGLIHCFTPFLKAGPHTVRVYWDNAASHCSLYLRAVRWQTLVSADSNRNGLKDWVENRIFAQNGWTVAPTVSRVSPAFIEGKGQYLSMMKISANSSGTESTIQVEPGVGDYWYANVPLSSDGVTSVRVSYQSGVLEESAQVAWEPVVVAATNNITIRKGDALLLTAAPTGATNGSMTIAIAGVTNYTTAASTPVSHQFDQAGTFTVLGGYLPTGTMDSMTVKVVDASFDVPVAAWVGKRRYWDCTNLPSEVVIEADPRIKFEQVPKLKPSQQMLLGQNGRRFSVTVDEAELRVVVARLGANGPVLASAPIVGFRLYNTLDTYLRQIEVHSDGSQLIEAGFILSPVPPQVNVDVQVLVSGVTFSDGTLKKKLIAADFDELGFCPVRFLRAAGVQTSVCHATKAYQNGTLIGWPGNPK